MDLMLVEPPPTRRRQSRERHPQNLPYGYRLRNGIRVEDPEEQAVLDLIRGLHAEGWSLRRIVDALEERRIPTKRGRVWHPATVRLLLTRSFSAVGYPAGV